MFDALYLNGIEFVCLLVLHYSLIRLQLNSKSTWFFLHAFANFVIALCCVPAILSILKEPDNALNSEYHKNLSSGNKVPLSFVNTLHLYHILFFKCNSNDLFHHIVFIPCLGLPGQIYDWGAMSNWLAFFVCGLPGGIDYFLLGFQKAGLLKNVDQKYISAKLNMWFRMPGVLSIISIMLTQTKDLNVPFWAVLLQYLFMPVNVIFYAESSVRSHQSKMNK